MSDFTFVTTNEHKVRTAEVVCRQFGISFDRANLELVEIQADNGEDIVWHKVDQAFQQLQKPVVVTDNSWSIPGLKGFPGPYMKYMNEWFTPEDFLRLTKPLQDRRIILHQLLAYQDKNEQKLFATDITGVLLKEIRGSSKFPHFTITSFDGGKHSFPEQSDHGEPTEYNQRLAWHDLCEWLKARA